MPSEQQFLPALGPAEGTFTPFHSHFIMGPPPRVTYEVGVNWSILFYLMECLFLFTPRSAFRRNPVGLVALAPPLGDPIHQSYSSGGNSHCMSYD